MAPSHRLLWRGALSHPFTPLDGIAFVAQLPAPSPTAAAATAAAATAKAASGSTPANNTGTATTPGKTLHALDSPVALALETLRGRPTLPVIGTWSGDVDVEHGIRMHINPSCQLTVAYFTRLFCTSPPSATSASPSPSQPAPPKHHTCLRISLGSSPDSASEDEVLLFPSPSAFTPSKLEILVGRARPAPTKPKRLPRPDDPLPRRVQDLRALTLEPKREARGVKRPLALARTASSVSLRQLLTDDVFSDPGAKRRRLSDEADAEKPGRPPVLRRKASKAAVEKGGKENLLRDGKDADREMPPPLVPAKSAEPPTLEEQNKALIRKHILSLLTSAGCPRSHAEFKDCFATINRGVVFALRRSMRKRRVEREEVIRLVGTHVGMYFIADSPVKAPRSKPREPLEEADEEGMWA
ncbi:hypothetical protein CALCODRAFT_506394 [Calocera cornea HHB12733]|uniref:Sld7 C-terminal domain-containing protein n=1 Tax=Calocera cornea HHB12733 TaxID=1353952 RepID=A0A165IZS5_9BASI|nr:hypothetical protein CALCODRAFT_506394 [Calocera cornea HHB12733]